MACCLAGTSIVSNVNRLVSEPTFIEIGEFRRHLLVLGNLHKNGDIQYVWNKYEETEIDMHP